MEALDQAVHQGKALYVGISNYPPGETEKAAQILNQNSIHCLIHQPKYSMFERWIEHGLLEVLEQYGIGCIAFSQLAQGLLTDRYLNGIPQNSRTPKPTGFLQPEEITEARLSQIRSLNELAKRRGQSLAQMAIAWVLRDPVVTSALIGVNRPEQLQQNLAALCNLSFSSEELDQIEQIIHS